MAHSTECGARWCVIRSEPIQMTWEKLEKGNEPRDSLVIFVTACRKRRQTAQQLLPLRTSAAIQYSPDGELLQLTDSQVDARFKNRRIERHATTYAAGGASSIPSMVRRGRQRGRLLV